MQRMSGGYQIRKACSQIFSSRRAAVTYGEFTQSILSIQSFIKINVTLPYCHTEASNVTHKKIYIKPFRLKCSNSSNAVTKNKTVSLPHPGQQFCAPRSHPCCCIPSLAKDTTQRTHHKAGFLTTLYWLTLQLQNKCCRTIYTFFIFGPAVELELRCLSFPSPTVSRNTAPACRNTNLQVTVKLNQNKCDSHRRRARKQNISMVNIPGSVGMGLSTYQGLPKFKILGKVKFGTDPEVLCKEGKIKTNHQKHSLKLYLLVSESTAVLVQNEGNGSATHLRHVNLSQFKVKLSRGILHLSNLFSFHFIKKNVLRKYFNEEEIVAGIPMYQMCCSCSNLMRRKGRNGYEMAWVVFFVLSSFPQITASLASSFSVHSKGN